MKALFCYEKDKLTQSGRFVLPLLLLFGYLAIAYAVAPLNILSSFSICSLVVFALMLSMGVITGGLCEPMIEQTIYVKIRQKTGLYMSKVWLMVAVSLIFALIAAFVPLLLHIINGYKLFDRAAEVPDIVSGIVLFWITGISGGVSGLLTSPRILPSRKLSIALGVLFCVLAVVKGPLIRSVAELKYALWLLPPVFDVSAAYSASRFFSFDNVLWSLLWLAAYTAAEIVLYAMIMRVKRFE